MDRYEKLRSLAMRAQALAREIALQKGDFEASEFEFVEQAEDACDNAFLISKPLAAESGRVMATEQERLSDITRRIGEALGKELGGRFNVLGNTGKEEAAGDVSRTLKIVDRWGSDDDELSCMIEIRKWDGRQ